VSDARVKFKVGWGEKRTDSVVCINGVVQGKEHRVVRVAYDEKYRIDSRALGLGNTTGGGIGLNLIKENGLLTWTQRCDK